MSGVKLALLVALVSGMQSLASPPLSGWRLPTSAASPAGARPARLKPPVPATSGRRRRWPPASPQLLPACRQCTAWDWRSSAIVCGSHARSAGHCRDCTRSSRPASRRCMQIDGATFSQTQADCRARSSLWARPRASQGARRDHRPRCTRAAWSAAARVFGGPGSDGPSVGRRPSDRCAVEAARGGQRQCRPRSAACSCSWLDR